MNSSVCSRLRRGRAQRPLARRQAAATLIYDDRGHLLLQLRDTTSGTLAPGAIAAFGGRIEHRETPRAAASREISEELSIPLSADDLLFVQTFDFVDDSGAIVTLHMFAHELPPNSRPVCTEGQPVWLTPEDALSRPNLAPYTRAAIERLRADPAGIMPITREERLLAIQTCLNSAIYEAQVYWQRNGLYMAVNSLLMGALFVTYESWSPTILLAFGIAGSLLNWHWPHVNSFSKYFAERWREDARALIRDDASLAEYIRAPFAHARVASPTGLRPSSAMNRLAHILRTGWIVLGCVAFAMAAVRELPDNSDRPHNSAAPTSTSSTPALPAPRPRSGKMGR